jgi:hypothetical protein
MADEPKLDMSRRSRFVWDDPNDITIIEATPEERARIEEMYKDVDFSALEQDQEEKSTSEKLDEIKARFDKVAKE